MSYISLTHQQRASWIRLIRTTNIGSVSLRSLIDRFGCPEKALDALLYMKTSGKIKKPVLIPTSLEIESEMEEADRIGARFIILGEKEYPKYLAAIPNPPPLLIVQGSLSVFSSTLFSIVGTRNASMAGLKLAQSFAKDLGEKGYAIVSGLARGIDTAAHRGALDSGTVAVLAGGIQKPYPPENKSLLEKIIEKGGAVISEMPLAFEPRAQDFPRRNRIIAGLSLGMLVVEATRKSGSLISARFALEMGRNIFATPGFPLDPRSFGTNSLIKKGALLVTEPEDIIEHMNPMLEIKPLIHDFKSELPFFEEVIDFDSNPSQTLSNCDKILEALGSCPCSLDELIRYTQLHPACVFMILLDLELAGKIERYDDGTVSLTFMADCKVFSSDNTIQ